MKIRITAIFLSLLVNILLPSAGGWSADMICAEEEKNLRIFYTEVDEIGWSAVLKGTVLSIGSRLDNEKGDISDSVHDRSRVTVRLYDRYGIKAGDSLFVINRRNLIVSRLRVATIFKSRTFGYMLVGYGNFLLANDGDRVAQKIEGEYSRYAYIYRSRGDYYDQVGEPGNAINSYNRAIELDRGNPEAHLALGYVYLKDNLLQFAFNEFSEAYKQIGRLYDNEDKFSLLRGMAEIRFREVYFEQIPDDLRKKYIGEGIRYSSEALLIYPDSRDANLYLGFFYYKNPEPDDVKARDHFLKVIQLEPENLDAHLALADLYHNHRNSDKARFYAERALKIDPANDRAKNILNLVR